MKRVICSVYFDALKESLPFRVRGGGGFRHVYEIPATKPDGFELLEVEDAEENVYVGEQRYLPTPVYADGKDGKPGIADSLANKWRAAGIATQFGGPGVMVIAGETPTKEELKAIRDRQRSWCRALVNEAESDWRAGNRHRVGETHRKAARWLGEMNYEWVWQQEAPQVVLHPCRFCRKPIDNASMVCPECGNVLDIQQYKRYLDELQAAGVTPPKQAAAAPLPPPLSPSKPAARA